LELRRLQVFRMMRSSKASIELEKKCSMHELVLYPDFASPKGAHDRECLVRRRSIFIRRKPLIQIVGNYSFTRHFWE